MRKYSFFLAALTLPAIAQEPVSSLEGAASLERAGLIRLVLERNPSIEVARSRISAAEALVTRSGIPEDPALVVGIAPLSIGESTLGARVGVSQGLPWPGRLRIETEIAGAELRGEEAELRGIEIELALRASHLFDEWYLIHRAIELNEHHFDLAVQMRASAEALYVSGGAAQQDPLQAEVRMTALSRSRIALDARRGTVMAAINSLLHRPPGSPVPPPPGELSVPAPPSSSISDQLEAAARANSELEAAAADVSKRDAELVLARLATRPDIEVMGEYSSMMMEDMRLMAGVRLRLPVRKGRIEASIAEARSRVSEARAVETSARDAVTFRLEQALLELRESLATIEIYESRLIPASRDQAEAARIGFSTGRSSFSALVDAEKNLEEVLLGYHGVVVDAWDAEARRQAVLGRIPFAERGE